MTSFVQDQYEKWPYPSIPTMAKVPREHLWQLNLNWIRSRCGLSPLKTSPSIWIAGCGTFEPYVFSLANPGAKIIASDLSLSSLQQAHKRLHWHGIKNTELRQIDLTRPEQFPEESFDFIECYGVLMCLPDPLTALKHLASKLKPDGILRIMVYPHYGRQRIFQIQRLARLLGLRFAHPEHPKLLRKILTSLPKSHPLQYAFTSYWDSKNLSGIVDGFLHASDREFTGIELCQMIDAAQLTPRFCFHRPWGQPTHMSQKLEDLGHYPFAFWLHYLDLWQSLRTNFTLCLTKKDLETKVSFDSDKHPLFDFSNPALGISYKTKLLKMGLTGAQLPSRTGEQPITLRAREMRRLIGGQGTHSELTLTPSIELWDRYFDPKWSLLQPQKHFTFRTGVKLLNPLYDYLFDAYTFHHKSLGFWKQPVPNLKTQIELWKNEAYPLENHHIPFGLTPFGTYLRHTPDIDNYLDRYLEAKEISFSDLALPKEADSFAQVNHFLRSHGIRKIPDHSESSLRQLWVLLFSFDRLFISL